MHRGPAGDAIAAAKPGSAFHRRARLAAALLVVLTLATGAVWAFALLGLMPLPGFELSAAAVEREILSWGAWGVGGSLLLMVLHSFVPFPAEFVAMANGMLYGPIWGTLITWTGAMLGAYLAFGLARWLGRPFVRTVVAPRHHRAIDRWAERQGGGVLLFSRFVPVISFNLINYAAGLTRVTWWSFTWTMALGILPMTVLMVAMGDQMRKPTMTDWLLLVAAGSLILAVVLVARRYGLGQKVK